MNNFLNKQLCIFFTPIDSIYYFIILRYYKKINQQDIQFRYFISRLR